MHRAAPSGEVDPTDRSIADTRTGGDRGSIRPTSHASAVIVGKSA
jgi:hypothetical protein